MISKKSETECIELATKVRDSDQRNSQLTQRVNSMEDDLVNQQNTLRAVKEENLNFSCDLRNTQKAQQNTLAELDNAKLREVSLRTELDSVRERNGELELLKSQLTSSSGV